MGEGASGSLYKPGKSIYFKMIVRQDKILFVQKHLSPFPLGPGVKFMMKTFFLSITFFSAPFLFAQPPKWDSTFRPNNFKLEVEQFRSYSDTGDIIFLGSSITAGIEWGAQILINGGYLKK